MGAVKLELHCGSQRVDGIVVDPEPDWSFDALVSELNALETKLATTSTKPSSLNKTTSRGNEIERGRTFKLHAHEYEMEDTESEDDDVNDDRALVVAGKRITCDELYLSDSDDSDVMSAFEVQPYLMDEVEEVEGALFELTHEHQLRVKDEIRSKISVLESALVNESQNATSSLLRVEKYKTTRQELDKKFDTQYQRRIAEELDNHLTAVQQDRERRSQIEERKIRNDAANEEAKRKIALQEEKKQQEKAKAEAEAKLRAEEAKQAALEAERKAVMETKRKAAMEAEKRAEKETIGNSERVTSGATQQEAAGRPTDSASSLSNVETKKSGNVCQAAASALNLEHGRLQKLTELYERNQLIRSSSNKDYTRHENHIFRNIKTIRGSRDSVRSKASDLIKLLNDPQYPQSISVETFAKKVVSNAKAPGSAPFASAYVIVLVTSQVPHAMDILLAELHRVCPYTVPKHMVYKKSTFQSKEAYFKSIGYWEENGKMESTEDYLQRLESYVKMYAALVQTEIPKVQNLHGLQHGWAWLARFLNSLPANQYTAVSLDAFLRMAGFALFRRYKSQFLKMLNTISENFLVDLKSRNAPELRKTIAEIQTYIEDKMFLQEPEGRSLQTNLLSKECVVR
ncbi:mRNA export factor GLE1-like isoform X2 [Lotus japonicus]|uniref:mRNA export factor GLE1 n=1 Tax=Lotus japonicus TaxID=34305 RepID=A0A510EAW8_LOTJA|nr:mRNA export factor GLE1-like isoform X2 [Lotus japonicus]BBI41219.1 nucleoporin [Lotus japonicus]